MSKPKKRSEAVPESAVPEPAPPKRKKSQSPLNDLDMTRWREYDDLVTESLWFIPERDRSGAHLGDYHGNFVPQIPYQAMRRYTKRGDVVIDPFLGSGTTLIECRRLGRHGIGLELKPELADATRARISDEKNPAKIKTHILTADSADIVHTPALIEKKLKTLDRAQAQLAILHPPYHSIIKFSERAEDLSNCPSVESFLQRFGQVVDVVTPFLETGRYLTLVIGDMYERGEWIPLGFQCMQAVMQRGYRLKSIVVKDMQNNRAKRNMQNIWRYRALAGGFFIFKHEYVMFFCKTA
jgi:hypothetical protein